MKTLKKTLKQLAVVVMVLTITIPVKAQWGTNGNDIYYNTGNVGIGTTVPQDLLNVNGGQVSISQYIVSSSTYDWLAIRSNRNINDYGGLYAQYAKIYLATPGPTTTGESSDHTIGDIRIATKGSGGNTTLTDRMTIRYNGNVGIGTTVPQDLLNVNGGQVSISQYIVSSSTYDWLAIRSNRNINDYGGLYAQYAKIYLATPGPTTTGESSDHTIGDIRIATKGSGGNTTLTDRMTIRYNGSVGIGTTSPTAKLDVIGAIRSSGSIQAEGAWSSAVVMKSTNVSGHQYEWYLDPGGIYGDFGLYDRTAASMRINVNAIGNVGIGTTSATEKLTVNGKILAEEVQVVVNVPDYVFTKEYKLKTLTEVSKFINEHKHLPEVPSEKEVLDNCGQVSLGEMNMTLLKKIEELTLYAIEQENNIKDQENNIKEQKENIQKQDEVIKALLKRVTELEKQ